MDEPVGLPGPFARTFDEEGAAWRLSDAVRRPVASALFADGASLRRLAVVDDAALEVEERGEEFAFVVRDFLKSLDATFFAIVVPSTFG